MTLKMALASSLRRRIALLVVLLLTASLLIAAGAVYGIMSLQQNMGIAVRGYQQLREVYEVGTHLVNARTALADDRTHSALGSIGAARLRLEAADDATGTIDEEWIDEAPRHQLVAQLDQISANLRENQPNIVTATALVNDALGDLARNASEVRTAIESHEHSAAQSRRAVMIHIMTISLLIVAGGSVLGMWVYRSVMRPLDRLSDGAKRFAAGELEHRLSESGDREFVALARSFNDMARDLSSFHRELQQRVETKSRQLVQSERLASVGYLAAGVAHEINNPLSIIAGYGERAMKLLDQPDADGRAAVSQAIGIICDEAFRCKKITDRMLMLARPSEQTQAKFSVAQVARDVVDSLAGIERFSDRRILISAEDDAKVSALGREGEMRQVVLNLVVNALEAAPGGSGEVRINVSRRNGSIELAVSDNGRGMTPDTVARVFEPFFTEKRAERPGTGLGLSVAHAIVTEFGGRIEATSGGLGQGSRFTITLTAADGDVA